MQRHASVALGAALSTMAPIGVALAAPTGPDSTRLPPPAPFALRTQVHGTGSIEHRMRVRGQALAAHRRLVARNLELTRTVRRLSHRALRAHARGARRWPSARLRAENHRLAAAERRARAAHRSATSTAGGHTGGLLAAIRACESGGNYSTDTGNGFYGAYQFTRSTWAGLGGTGNPASASPAEQDRRAAMLLARSGAGQWPICGR